MLRIQETALDDPFEYDRDMSVNNRSIVRSNLSHGILFGYPYINCAGYDDENDNLFRKKSFGRILFRLKREPIKRSALRFCFCDCYSISKQISVLLY